MATSYTSLLGLALPTTGELQGTWGDTVNNSITSLLDSAVAGTTTLSTDGDVTLTTTTGAANQSRQAILLCSGARTALRTITAPAQSKIYTVINATTGGYSVKLVGVGPTTGVTIVAGESAVCAWNGSDFIKVSNTAGGGTFTDLTVSNSLTLSYGTANGVLYLNGSKVATSGSALTFDGTNFATTGKIGAGGSPGTYTQIWSSGNVMAADGSQIGFLANSAGAPANYMTGSNASNYLAWIANNSEQMRLTSTGLGIGTSSPASPLTINGNDPLITLKNAGTNRWQFGLENTSSNRFVFYDNTAAAYRLILDSSGNLGLGVTPSAWGSGLKAFQASTASFMGDGTATYVSSNYYYNAGNKYIGNGYATSYQTYNGQHVWLTAGNNVSGAGAAITFTQAMTLDASGNLALGTTSPNLSGGSSGSQVITVSASSSGRNGILELNGTRTTSGDYVGYVRFFNNAAATPLADIQAIRGSSDTTGVLTFATSGSERARIDSSGNFGIGTNSPSAKLDVFGNVFIGSTTVGGMGPQTGLTVVGGATVSSGDPGILTLGAHLNARSVGDPIGKIDFYSNDASGSASGVQASIRGITEGSLGESAGLTFYTGTSSSLPERVRIDTSGNVGIGTAAPVALLNVVSGTNTTLSVPSGVVAQFKGSVVINSLNTGGAGDVDSLYFQKSHGSGINIYNYNLGIIRSYTSNGYAGGLDFYTNKNVGGGNYVSTFAMRIDENQRLGVNTNAPAAQFEVSIAASTSGEIARFTSPSYDSVYIAAGSSISSCGIGTLSSSAFNLFVNSSSKAVLTNSGNFGVGVANPSSKLEAYGEIRNSSPADSGNKTQARLTAYRDGSNWGYIGYGDDAIMRIVYAATAGSYPLLFGTTSGYDNTGTFTQTMAMNSSGLLILKGGSDTAAAGVAFPATQVASSNANTLDDYEEGGWTPTLYYQNTTGVTRTYTSQEGGYTKIGNTVTAWARLAGATSNSGSYANDNIGIGGLPFTASANGTAYPFATVGHGGFTGSATVGAVGAQVNSTVMVFLQLSSVTAGNLADEFGSATAYEIYVTVTYRVA